MLWRYLPSCRACLGISLRRRITRSGHHGGAATKVSDCTSPILGMCACPALASVTASRDKPANAGLLGMVELVKSEGVMLIQWKHLYGGMILFLAAMLVACGGSGGGGSGSGGASDVADKNSSARKCDGDFNEECLPKSIAPVTIIMESGKWRSSESFQAVVNDVVISHNGVDGEVFVIDDPKGGLRFVMSDWGMRLFRPGEYGDKWVDRSDFSGKWSAKQGWDMTGHPVWGKVPDYGDPSMTGKREGPYNEVYMREDADLVVFLNTDPAPSLPYSNGEGGYASGACFVTDVMTKEEFLENVNSIDAGQGGGYMLSYNMKDGNEISFVSMVNLQSYSLLSRVNPLPDPIRAANVANQYGEHTRPDFPVARMHYPCEALVQAATIEDLKSFKERDLRTGRTYYEAAANGFYIDFQTSIDQGVIPSFNPYIDGLNEAKTYECLINSNPNCSRALYTSSVVSLKAMLSDVSVSLMELFLEALEEDARSIQMEQEAIESFSKMLTAVISARQSLDKLASEDAVSADSVDLWVTSSAIMDSYSELLPNWDDTLDSWPKALMRFRQDLVEAMRIYSDEGDLTEEERISVLKTVLGDVVSLPALEGKDIDIAYDYASNVAYYHKNIEPYEESDYDDFVSSSGSGQGTTQGGFYNPGGSDICPVDAACYLCDCQLEPRCAGMEGSGCSL